MNMGVDEIPQVSVRIEDIEVCTDMIRSMVIPNCEKIVLRAGSGYF